MAVLKALLCAAALLQLSTAQFLTAAPILQLHRRQLSACSRFVNIESSCEAATPSFSSLSYSSQLACLCELGDTFDSAFAGCLRYVSTESPALYRSLTDLGLPSSPCAADFVPTTESPTTPTSTRIVITSTSRGSSTATGAIADDNLSSCSSFVSVEDVCTTATPGFSDLPGSSQALCLCYTSSTYAPEIYDGYRDGCLSYFQTADPPRYQTLVRNGAASTSVCSSVGDVAGGSGDTSTSTRTTSSTTRTTNIIRPTGSTSSTTSTTTGGAPAPTSVAGGVSIVAAMGALALALAL